VRGTCDTVQFVVCPLLASFWGQYPVGRLHAGLRSARADAGACAGRWRPARCLVRRVGCFPASTALSARPSVPEPVSRCCTSCLFAIPCSRVVVCACLYSATTSTVSMRVRDCSTRAVTTPCGCAAYCRWRPPWAISRAWRWRLLKTLGCSGGWTRRTRAQRDIYVGCGWADPVSTRDLNDRDRSTRAAATPLKNDTRRAPLSAERQRGTGLPRMDCCGKQWPSVGHKRFAWQTAQALLRADSTAVPSVNPTDSDLCPCTVWATSWGCWQAISIGSLPAPRWHFIQRRRRVCACQRKRLESLLTASVI